MPIVSGSRRSKSSEMQPSCVINVPSRRVNTVIASFDSPNERERRRGVTFLFCVRAEYHGRTSDHPQLLLRVPLSRKKSTLEALESARQGLNYLARNRALGADHMEVIEETLDNPPAFVKERAGLEMWQSRSIAAPHDRSLKGLWNAWFTKGR